MRREKSGSRKKGRRVDVCFSVCVFVWAMLQLVGGGMCRST